MAQPPNIYLLRPPLSNMIAFISLINHPKIFDVDKLHASGDVLINNKLVEYVV